MDDATVLVPVSGAAIAEPALRVAVDLAGRLRRPLRLISFVEDVHEVAQRLDRLDQLVAQLQREHPEVPMGREVQVNPHAPAAIVEACRPDTIVVMATSPRINVHDHYLGSAAETVVRRSGRPIVLVGPHCEARGRLEIETVTVPVDGSRLSEEVVGVGVDWAQHLAVPLCLVTVLPQEVASSAEPAGGGGDGSGLPGVGYLRRLARKIDPAAVEVSCDVLYGDDPTATICHRAGDHAFIVMSTHGRTGLARIAVGSVAARVVRGAACPVVVQRPPGAV